MLRCDERETCLLFTISKLNLSTKGKGWETFDAIVRVDGYKAENEVCRFLYPMVMM